MYIHLGEDVVVNASKIIGIFDMDTSTVNKATRDYLFKAEKNKKIIYVNYELPRSFAVTVLPDEVAPATVVETP